MQFSDLFKSSSRVSYVPRQGYGKLPPPANVPKLDSLHLSDACGFSLPFDSTISMEQYLSAVGDIVGDLKMVFAGKSNDHIKIYLINEAEVLKFYENNPQVVINDKPLTVRKLINNGHKIYLCNTKPGIPDSHLISELSKYTKVLSPLKFVSLGVRNTRFSHLIGFKRAVMVEEVNDLPASINVLFGDYLHKIFITIEKAKCFRCQGEGHLVKNCTVDPPASAQERFSKPNEAHTSNNVHSVPPLNNIGGNNITKLFVPSFASRTTVGAPTPLNDKEVVAPSSVSPLSQDPLVSDSSPPQVISTNADVHASSTPSDVADKNHAPCKDTSKGVKYTSKPPINSDIDLTSDSDVELFVAPPPMVSISTVAIGTKRGCSSSPEKSGKDKKVCINPAPAPDNLQILVPLLNKSEPSMDPDIFINLIEDLKNQTGVRKVDIIKSQYSLDPLTIASLCEKLVFDHPSALHKSKLKTRLRNLHKTLTGVLFPDEGCDADGSSPISQS